MRLIAILVIFAAVSVTTARASAPGAYAQPAAQSGNDCIKLCEDDSLCVGSTYEAGACGLWASVPRAAPSHFTLSTHAPGFTRRLEVAEAERPLAPPEHPAPAQPETAAVALLGGYDPSEDIRPRLGGD